MKDSINYLSSIGIDITKDQIKLNSQKKVIVGMSGGVDSSVCAVISKLMGYETIGIFMRNWEEVDENGHCSAEDDYADVISVCEKIDIPYYSINFAQEYRKNVFQHFLDEYESGHTPNPDILCNKEIKFKVFYEKAMEFGADFLATGHYCQIQSFENAPMLVKGFDKGKDQTYFLYAIEGQVLEHVLFPIGHLPKKQVRQIASDFDLPTKNKKDSTGICFIGERDFKDFLKKYLASKQGHFVHLETGKVLGPHEGSCFYTTGQRKGLGLGGPGGPWFVASRDTKTNQVYVVEGEKHPALYSDDCLVTDITWINPNLDNINLITHAKVRYRQEDQKCSLEILKGEAKVVFQNPQRAIAVGQSVVFYKNELCLGGAVVSKLGKNYFEQKKTLP